MIIRIGESNILKWDAMKDASDDTAINNATVTWALNDEAGTEQFTGSLTYVTGSVGKYTGEITEVQSATLTNNAKYELVITAINGSLLGQRSIKCRARKNTNVTA